MISRALTLALWCACAWALTPLSAAGDDNECALYLAGPGRTSAYDYSLNLLKGNFGYEGQHTCITYDAVNQAYLEARNRIVVSQPKGDWKPEDFASVGELMLDISINLARTYGLTYEEIEKGLPLIDTSRTLIREVCPPVFSHVECRAGKYRRLDGLCNNLEHPTWGATNAPFQRLIGPLFADGINAPRIAHTGRDLPLSRVVSRTMHPDDGFHDHAGTVMVIAWGQFMDHDYTLTGTPLDPINRNDPEECCKRPPHLKHPYCNEIRVPEDDYFYRLFGVKCIDFVRAFPSPRPGCRLGSRVPFNTLTGVIDGNTVYGVTDKFARKLRTGYGGLLRMNPVFKEYGLKDLLPLKLDIPDEGCTRPNKNMYCFEAGEIRVNEQLVLTVMHTLMAREHNRVAKALAEVNPHWDDETLYQEARRINIAEIQHITYNEFLPILLGKDVMEKFGLVLEKEGYWDGYDSDVNPDVIDSFAAAAYRFGHSLLPTAVERWSKAHKFIASKRLSDLIRRPYDLYRAGVLDEYVMGLMNQVAQAMDDSITQEVTNHLFKKIGARFGMDLVSFNMQRGREFGLPGYMEFRKFCGLPGAESFQDLFGSMSNSTVRKYETIFEHPIDVDLWSGGVSERPLPGSMLGPTFACIIATQFSYSRRGDRFWYELPNQPSTFTPEQLTEVRKARLARVICDNTDIIDTVQLYPMVLPDHELNPRVPCRSGIIPSIDFTKWAEPAPFHGAAKQFMTNAFVPKKQELNNTSNTATNNSTAININNSISDKDNADNCNITNPFSTTEKPSLLTLHVAENFTSKSIVNDTTNYSQDCGINTKNSSKDCIASLAKVNEITNSDTVLKYVYKNNDNKSTTTKSPGHPLNSLRKKRSLELKDKFENITTDATGNAPLIVDYETIHTPEKSNSDNGILTQRFTENTVQNSALANFNIQTLHEPSQTLNKEDRVNDASLPRLNDDSKENEENQTGTKDENRSNSDESSEERDPGNDEPDSKYRKKYTPNESSEEINEKEEYRKNSSDGKDSHELIDTKRKNIKMPHRVNDNSNEQDQYRNNFSSNEDRREDTSHDDISKRLKDSYNEYERHPRKPVNNFERYEDHPRKTEGSFEKYDDNPKKGIGSFEKYEDKEYPLRSNAPYSKPRIDEKDVSDSSENSESKENHESSDSTETEKLPLKEQKDKYYNDNENSKESESSEYSNEDNSGKSIEKSDHNNNDDTKYQRNRYSTRPQDPENKLTSPLVIQDVDLGDFSYERVQVDKKGQIISANEDVDLSSAKPIINSDSDDKATQTPSSEIDEQLKSEIYESIKQPVRINGEIKPVVEITNENNDGETSLENSKESLKSNPESDISLESFLGTNEKNNQVNNKNNYRSKGEENEDVKQQFERIPTNYKHETNKKEEDDVENSHETKENGETHSGENKQEVLNDGTLNTFSPKDVNYDDHLNYKFGDVSIKLPEIKLPEDVLSYAYEEPPYKKEKNHYKNRKSNPQYQDFKDYDGYSSGSPRKQKDNGKHDHDEDHDYEYYGYHQPSDDVKEKHKKNSDKEENDEDEDLYEKFVRERFGKQDTFQKRSEKLQDASLPYNPKLYETVQNLLAQTKKIDEQAKKSGDPNAGYKWTLEYGENLK